MKLFCPRDAKPLSRALDAEYGVFTCPKCEGVWVSRAVLSKVLKDEEEELPKFLDVHPMEAQHRKRVLCPVDRIKMKILVGNKVELDGCGKCGGFWMDKGEFKKLLDSLDDREKPHILLQLGEFLVDEGPDLFEDGFMDSVESLRGAIKGTRGSKVLLGPLFHMLGDD